MCEVSINAIPNGVDAVLDFASNYVGTLKLNSALRNVIKKAHSQKKNAAFSCKLTPSIDLSFMNDSQRTCHSFTVPTKGSLSVRYSKREMSNSSIDAGSFGCLSAYVLSSEVDGTGSIDIYSRTAVLSILSNRR